MSTYQLTCWKIEDFDQPDRFLGAGTHEHCNPMFPMTIRLTDRAEERPLHISSADQAAGKGQYVCLAEDLIIGAQRLAAGSHLIPETCQNIENVGGALLISGRIVPQIGNPECDGLRVVFSTARLNPNQTLFISNNQSKTADNGSQNRFSRGTLIETPHGQLPIEQLEDGDEVMMRNGRVQMISWINNHRLTGLELVLNPILQPVRIMAGALTGGRPGQDLIVSQGHRLLVDDWRAPYLFGEDEILVPARSLLNDKNVFMESPLSGVDYFQILTEGHSMVCANGLWAETMLPAHAVATSQPILPALPHNSAQSFAA